MHRIITGDCLDVMERLYYSGASYDAIVTDPPYEMGFMGKAWDKSGISFQPSTWARAYKLLKPGGHLLAFSSARTYHRIAGAIEEAGFEIRDQVMWIYGSGWNKVGYIRDSEGIQVRDGCAGSLKPAHEPICLARKPMIGTVAANVHQFGTGGLNIDGCRIEGRDRTEYGLANAVRSKVSTYGEPSASADFDSNKGRWPANVIHDGSDEVEAAFAVFGFSKDTAHNRGERHGAIYGNGRGPSGPSGVRGFNESGTASRFFYCAKASKADRDDGLKDMPSVPVSTLEDNGDSFKMGSGNTRKAKRRNNHPTVKPTALMCYLCRLITPPGGVILDPFAGTGSTGRGALLEGFGFVGIEADPAWAEVARKRVQAVVRDAHTQASELAQRAGGISSLYAGGA